MEEIKRIPVKLLITEFIISFEYETFKGNHRRKGKRSIKQVSKQDAKDSFKVWSKSIRTMSNVKILDIEETEIKQEIAI